MLIHRYQVQQDHLLKAIRTKTPGGIWMSPRCILRRNCTPHLFVYNSIIVRLLNQLDSLDNFFPNASQFGFFLDVRRFCTSFALPYPLGHPYRPSSALLSTLYLWGLHLSRTDTLRVHEKTFLSRSIQQTSTALSGSHPQKVLHALQAEILLAYYFFRNGRIVEGKYHCSAAASITISSGLNKIRSSRRSSSVPDFVGNTSPTLPPPRDAVDEGERINGFWAAVVLDKCWSVSLGLPSNFTDDEALGTLIDTPWPLDSSGYEQVRLYFSGVFIWTFSCIGDEGSLAARYSQLCYCEILFR